MTEPLATGSPSLLAADSANPICSSAAMTSPRLALAATDGDLLGRIRRILNPKETDMSLSSAWSPVVGAVLVAGLLVPVSLISARQDTKPLVTPPATGAALVMMFLCGTSSPKFPTSE